MKMDENENWQTYRLVIITESDEHIADVDLDHEQFSALVKLGLITLIENALESPQPRGHVGGGLPGEPQPPLPTKLEGGEEDD